MFSSLAQSQNLYSQVVLSSGNAVMTTRTLAHQHGVYEKFLEHFSIPPNLSPQEKVDRLRSISVSDLLNAYYCTGSPLPNWQATVDGHLLERLPATSGLAQQKYDSRIRRIMVGDCEEEVRCKFPMGSSPFPRRSHFLSIEVKYKVRMLIPPEL